MATNTNISAAFFFLCLIACEPDRHPQLDGTWVNHKLDYIRFSKDTFEVAFGLYTGRTIYGIKEDSIILKSRDIFFHPDDLNSPALHYSIRGKCLQISSNAVAGYLAGTAKRPLEFIRSDSLFNEEPWDSLVYQKHEAYGLGPYGTLMEKITISKSGKITLETRLIDSLRGAKYESTIPQILRTELNKEISLIDTAYFYLLHGQTSHGFNATLEIYRRGGKQHFAGLDEVPVIFVKLRNFLCCEYQKLPYKRR